MTEHGTFTFVYTDVEGSTRMAHADPATFDRANDRHLALLKGAFAAAGGDVFRLTGDGLCAAFPTAAAAVAAAVDAQRRLCAEPWPAGFVIQ